MSSMYENCSFFAGMGRAKGMSLNSQRHGARGKNY